MSTSSELMYAILAMDAYNRGYSPGIVLTGSQIGTATITTDSTREFRDPGADPEAPTPDQAAGFYAVAYEWNGETIISYRGTDTNLELLLTDYPIASNDNFDVPSVHLAPQFYQAVASQQGVDPNTITTTGHSLGGALAGFVGTLYGRNVVAVDPIDFFPAVLNFKALIDRYQTVQDTPEAELDWIDLPGLGFFPTVIYAEAQLTAMGFSLDNIPSISAQLDNYISFYLSGSIAEFAREPATPSTPTLEGLLPDMGSTVGWFDAHSASLNVIVKYAEDQYNNSGQNLEELAFRSIIDPLFNSLFDETIAVQGGFEGENVNGRYSAATKQLAAIGYSALEGSVGLVFGNTGIRALFDDANEVGKLVDEGKAPTGYTDTVSGLAKSIVQFGGQMALQKVDYIQHGDKHPEAGFLTVEDNGRLLKADLTKGLWNLGGANANEPVEVIGIQNILDPFFANDPAAAVLLAGMQRLYGVNETHDSSVINRLDFALGTDALTVALSEPEANAETSHANTTSLFVGLGTTIRSKATKIIICSWVGMGMIASLGKRARIFCWVVKGTTPSSGAVATMCCMVGKI